MTKEVCALTSAPRKLREELEKPGCILAVGVFDALSARIAEKLGFRAAVMGGYNTSASLLGKPDIGLLTLTEMVRHLNYICEASGVPIIADGDTGYGNPLNVMRTVREYEKAGAAAILLEDQVAPKRCGHMEGKQVIPAEEQVQKIRAAVDARSDPDFVIIARTDARNVNGIDDAIRRAKMYREAGADMTFVEAPTTVQELQRIVDEIDAPQIANMIEGGKTPYLDVERLGEMGYKIGFYTLGTYYAVAKAVIDFMVNLKNNGSSAGFEDRLLSFAEFNEIVGLSETLDISKRYA
jgi:carboxyvinyl-carboxyphosphonate phosphorylmutase